MLNSFCYYWTLAKQPKMLPSHIVVKCQKWRFSNHLKNPANKPSLTDIEMSLDQINHTYPCLTAFIMTEHWLKQPKMLPSHFGVECQKWRFSNHHSTPANNLSLSAVGLSLVQIKHTYPCLTAFLLLNTGWSNQKCCPATLLLSAKNEGAPTTTALLQISLPWQL